MPAKDDDSWDRTPLTPASSRPAACQDQTMQALACVQVDAERLKQRNLRCQLFSKQADKTIAVHHLQSLDLNAMIGEGEIGQELLLCTW